MSCDSSVIIRAESLDGCDEAEVRKLLIAAFQQEDESKLVQALRLHPSHEPRLALVAVKDNNIIGHCMMTRLRLTERKTTGSASFLSTSASVPPVSSLLCLSLAPVSVLPAYQRQGVGSRLIRHALTAAAELGYHLVFVLGDAAFYARFGFDNAVTDKVHCNYNGEHFMAKTLQDKDKRLLYEIPDVDLHYPEPFHTLSEPSIKFPINVISMNSSHWPAVAAIYAEGIRTGLATFEDSVPTWEVFDCTRLPHSRFVALCQGMVCGWAALSPVSHRVCYAGVAEVSVYVSAQYQRRGIGSALLQQLITSSESHNIWTLQSSLILANLGSIALHEHNGFRRVGVRDKIAKLNGEWKDVVLMERRSGQII